MNVFSRPTPEARGLGMTSQRARDRLIDRLKAEGISDPRGRPIYWIGPPGEAEDDGPGTDFHAVREGYISITPIQVDLTRYQALDKVAGWVSSLSLELGAAVA